MQNSNIQFKVKTASADEIKSHLIRCKNDFLPPLDQTVDIGEYAKKIFDKAITFEAWSGDVLVGLVAAYMNDEVNRVSYVTNVSLLGEYKGKGIAKATMDRYVKHVEENMYREIRLEVNKGNVPAVSLYRKLGFCDYKSEGNSLFMKRVLVPSEQPLLSVVCATYNHEKYIGQAIESFLMQQTSFPFEVVIGEDCSTDRTREICLDYQSKYPGRIRLLLRENNMGAMENHLGIIESCASKYLANCEGDDYWTDPLKLQKQVDFLENHQDYSFSGHDVLIEFEATKKKTEHWKRKWDKKDVVTIEDIIKNGGAATGSLVWRNKIFGEFPGWFREQKAGDWGLQILCASKGGMKYFQETMGVYRIHGSGSHQVRIEEAKKKGLDFVAYLYDNMKMLIDALDTHFNGEYADLLETAKHHNHLRAFDEYFAIGDIENCKIHAREVLPSLLSFKPSIIVKVIIKNFIIHLPQKIAESIIKKNKA